MHRTQFRHLIVLALSLSAIGQTWRQADAADAEKRHPDSAAFNSDATRIVYVDSVTPAGQLLPTTSEIWTIFPDGQGKQRLTVGHKDKNPHFSPDGKHILFERDNDGEIWMMNTGGDGLRNLTNTPHNYEHGAQFSNDGDTLFFLAPAPNHFTAEDLAANPFLALGISDVVMRLDLKEGTQREILGANYGASAVLPDSDNDKEVLVICKALDADGKPRYAGEKTLVAVPLDGSAPHTVYNAPDGYELNDARMGGNYLAMSAKAQGRYTASVFLLPKAKAAAANADDLQTLDKLVFLGDLSCDGLAVIGSGIISGIDKWGLLIYDIKTDKWHTVLEE